MSTAKVNNILFSLSETDKEIQQFVSSKQEIEQNRADLLDRRTVASQLVERLDAALKDAEAKFALEERQMKDEEEKIVERRKQLSAIGGAKSAKLMERELEIASRMLQTMEETTTQTRAEIEILKEQFAKAKTDSESLDKEYSALVDGSEETLTKLEKDISKLEGTRGKQLDKLEPRLKNLYSKVNSRYPGEGVAVAKEGSCRSCYRSLPAQLYNQVMAGNMLLQCPGCSRILVYAENVKAAA